MKTKPNGGRQPPIQYCPLPPGWTLEYDENKQIKLTKNKNYGLQNTNNKTDFRSSK